MLFEYDLLASSRSGREMSTARRTKPSVAATNVSGSIVQQPVVTKHQENLIAEISGILGKARNALSIGMGGDKFQDNSSSRTLACDLKEEAGIGDVPQKRVSTTAGVSQLPLVSSTPSPHFAHSQEDPKTKYMAKVTA